MNVLHLQTVEYYDNERFFSFCVKKVLEPWQQRVSETVRCNSYNGETENNNRWHKRGRWYKQGEETKVKSRKEKSEIKLKVKKTFSP